MFDGRRKFNAFPVDDYFDEESLDNSGLFFVHSVTLMWQYEIKKKCAVESETKKKRGEWATIFWLWLDMSHQTGGDEKN